ncbi:MAG: MucR family transcriptional regulator [Alphaproteobacteria bacterium]
MMEHEINSDFSLPKTSTGEVLHLVSDVVSAYLSNNSLEAAEVPALINQVYTTLTSLGGQHRFLSERPDPVVSIKKSITEDYIVCLEDGKRLKMLKRHLKTVYNMTPEQYRERWSLPADYPMVAPNYAKTRSNLAKSNGLGRSRGKSSNKPDLHLV